MRNFTRKNLKGETVIRFLGNMEAKADMKGRVFIPAQFRKQLQIVSEGNLIMRKNPFADCLVLYPQSVWDHDLNEMQARLSKWNPKHQMVLRQYVSDVEIITPDSNGRILIPKRYMQMVGIVEDVRFIGMDDTIEIWAKEKADASFMPPEAFAATLEEIMTNNHSQE